MLDACFSRDTPRMFPLSSASEQADFPPTRRARVVSCYQAASKPIGIQDFPRIPRTPVVGYGICRGWWLLISVTQVASLRGARARARYLTGFREVAAVINCRSIAEPRRGSVGLIQRERGGERERERVGREGREDSSPRATRYI